MSDDQDGCEQLSFSWYRPTQVVPNQRLLNGCVCVSMLPLALSCEHLHLKRAHKNKLFLPSKYIIRLPRYHLPTKPPLQFPPLPPFNILFISAQKAIYSYAKVSLSFPAMVVIITSTHFAYPRMNG